MKRIAILPVMLIAGSLSWGCAAGPAVPKSFDWDQNRHRVLLLDRDLRSVVRVDDAVADWTSDGRLIAKLKIRNHSNERIHLLLQTIYKDSHGKAVDRTDEWQNILIPQNSTYFHEQSALSRDATDFLIQIRRGMSH